MALTKTAQSLASQSNAAGATTTSSAFDANYGASGVVVVTNGATGPTIPCDVVVETSNDGGSTWEEWFRQTCSATASAVTTIPISLGIGSGADFGKYRVKFTANTAQPVTVQYDGSTTASL